MHAPEHATVLEFPPATVPYVRKVHGVQTLLPALLYCPAGHKNAVALVLPAGHAYPALQLPEQPALVSPLTLPNVPAGHRKPLEELAPELQ